MELRSTRNEIEKYVSQDEFEDTIGEGLKTLHAGMKTFGKPFDEYLLKAFVLVLGAVGATLGEFRATMASYLVGSTPEFPTPGEFGERLRNLRGAGIEQEVLDMAALAIKREDEARHRTWLMSKFGKLDPSIEELRAESLANEDTAFVMSGLEIVDGGESR